MIPETNLFCDVFYQHDLAAMGTKALFFVPPDDLASIRDTLATKCRLSLQFTRTTNLPVFFRTNQPMFRTSSTDTNTQTDSLVQSLPFLTGILNQATTSHAKFRQAAVPRCGIPFWRERSVRTSTSP
jgi:hypothetical protein